MGHIILIIGLIGAALIALGYVPQSIQSIKTKNTVGVSAYMFVLIFGSSVLFVIYASLLIAHGFRSEQAGESKAQAVRAGIIAGVPILITRLFIGILSAIVCWIKYTNIFNAKKHKLDEHTYYEIFLAPKFCPLRKKMNN